jgi:hypothetical protein
MPCHRNQRTSVMVSTMSASLMVLSRGESMLKLGEWFTWKTAAAAAVVGGGDDSTKGRQVAVAVVEGLGVCNGGRPRACRP